MNRSFFVAAGVTLAFAVTAAAQEITLVGTGDPNVDVPAVQAAVDQGGQVVLKGHFSFDAPPTVSESHGGLIGGLPPLGMVLVSKAVVISGAQDDQGQMATIEGGTNPFYVEAPGAHVTIRGLRFVRPKTQVINVVAVRGLVIDSNRIEGVELTSPFSVTAISVEADLNAFSPQPGLHAEDVSGTLTIANNDIDLQGTTAAAFIAIAIVGVGKSPDQEVDLYISRNNIRNSSERPINIYGVGGRAYVERNVITTTAGAGLNVMPSGDVMHIVGPGSFLIAHNTIDCQWTSGQQAGIRLMTRGQMSLVSHAIVVENEINMLAPEGTQFSATSAAIEVRGAGDSNIVANNRIRGRANFALSVVNQGGTPQNTAFIMNDLSGFTSAQADLFVDAGGMNTIVVGAQSKVEDHGSGTLIVPVR